MNVEELNFQSAMYDVYIEKSASKVTTWIMCFQYYFSVFYIK